MKTISRAREEFNSTMNPYVAMIVRTEYRPFNDSFFAENRLTPPTKRIAYTPPPWVGAEYSSNFLAGYGQKGFYKTRREIIPEIDSPRNYLICDDYCSTGETFEIAMLRLVEAGVKLDNIWCLSDKGNVEIKSTLLDRGIEWHKYRIEQKGITRQMLEGLGFEFPSLKLD